MVKNKKSKAARNNLTFYLGVGLFSLIVVGAVGSIIVPWLTDLFDPNVIKQNVVLLLLSLLSAAILPTLLAYIIGYRTTGSSDKHSRRYNGVMLAIAAFWLSLVFSSVRAGMAWTWTNNSSTVANFLQAAAPVLIVWFVAVLYTRSKSKSSLLESDAYRAVLITALVATLALPIIQTLGSGESLYLPGLVYPASAVLLTLTAYALLKNRLAQRLTLAVVTMSMGLIAFNAGGLVLWVFFGQLSDVALVTMSAALALAVWAVYLRANMTRAAR